MTPHPPSHHRTAQAHSAAPPPAMNRSFRVDTPPGGTPATLLSTLLSALTQGWRAGIEGWTRRQRRLRDHSDLQDMSSSQLNDLGIGRSEIPALIDPPDPESQRRP